MFGPRSTPSCCVAFLIITLLFIAMAVASLLILVNTTAQSRLLDEAHERVSWSQQSQHALARQMHFTRWPAVEGRGGDRAQILRENNRFNETLAKLETAAPPGRRALIDQIRASQDDAMGVVADIANAIRDGKLDDITAEAATARGTARRRRSRCAWASWSTRSRTAWRACAQRRRRRPALADPDLRASPSAPCCWPGCAGFVISWSFILPVREAPSLPRTMSRRETSGAKSRSPTVTNSARSPTG